MNWLVNAMKVIKLKDEVSGQYLTADDNMVSVTLTTPNTKGWNPKNTEWRLEWLNDPKGLVGQVRLWSVYNKVLTFAGEPADYVLYPLYDALTQESWPVVTGADTAEWRFELSSRNKNATLVGDLFKRSLALSASDPDPKKGPSFVSKYFFRKSLLKWINFSSWVVEVVVSPLEMAKDEVNHHQPKCYDHAMSTLSRWQVGQVYLHVSPTPTGVHTSAGYNYNQYYNSGRNVNGSGNQKNGDVTVRSDINRSRDNNANFLNYEYA